MIFEGLKKCYNIMFELTLVLPKNNFVEVDILVLVATIHQQGVLHVPPCLPEVPGVALPHAVLHTKLNINLVCCSNVCENCVFY